MSFPSLPYQFEPHGMEDEDAPWAASQPPGAVREVFWSDRWHEWLYDFGGSAVVVDLDPGPAGTYGQIVAVDRDEGTRFVLAPSLTAFLTEFLERLEGGKLCHDARSVWFASAPPDGRCLRFGIADNFPGFGAVPE